MANKVKKQKTIVLPESVVDSAKEEEIETVSDVENTETKDVDIEVLEEALKGSIADKMLSLYNEEEYLYIGKVGEVFPIGTNVKFLGEAKKYKNLYYKKQ